MNKSVKHVVVQYQDCVTNRFYVLKYRFKASKGANLVAKLTKMCLNRLFYFIKLLQKPTESERLTPLQVKV